VRKNIIWRRALMQQSAFATRINQSRQPQGTIARDSDGWCRGSAGLSSGVLPFFRVRARKGGFSHANARLTRH
jgi:hypothetical protein